MSEHYVSPLGNDANSGETLAEAVQHVAAGVELLGPSDTLLLADGVYAEHVTIRKLLRVEIRSLEGGHRDRRLPPGFGRLRTTLGWPFMVDS
jgi:hypothetical protein